MSDDSTTDFSAYRYCHPSLIYDGPKIERYFGNSWSMHLPFAYELIKQLNPRTYVELGVWKGESYFTFCQSVRENGLATRCFGVDTWEGDVHMVNYDANLKTEVAAFNQKYADFSTLLVSSFSKALASFEDKSIDLLHIDGAHRYEDVKEDFDTWVSKVSENGIIIFHDVIVRENGFGVWKLWEEIKVPGRAFLFEFGHGLGVWKKTALKAEDSLFIRRLFTMTPEASLEFQSGFAKAACGLDYYQNSSGGDLYERQRKDTETTISTAKTNILNLKQELKSVKEKVTALQAALERDWESPLKPLKVLLQSKAERRAMRQTRAEAKAALKDLKSTFRKGSPK